MASRMQITLDPSRRAAVQRKAAAAGVSIAEYVRGLIDADLGEPPNTRPDVSVVFGLGNSGGSDVARHKHEYLGQAVDDAHPRE